VNLLPDDLLQSTLRACVQNVNQPSSRAVFDHFISTQSEID